MSVHLIARSHAVLSPSGSGKWLVCTPSAQLEEQFPNEDTAYSLEGTLAHKVFERMLRATLEKAVDDGYEEFLATVSEGMLDHVNDAYDKAMELINDAYERCADPVIMLERRLDFTPWVPGGFGTGDLVIITDGVVEVADLKYGKGVMVNAVGNTQMRLYGLGAYNELRHLYEMKTIRTHVLQPRLDNYGSEEMTVEELLQWADEVVVPKARMAWEGEGELIPGEHCHSHFCRARFTCPARNAAAQELVESSFALQPPDMLNDTQMSQVLARADQVIKWLSDVKEWAFKRAESGHAVPGFKLVEGRSNRKYKDADAVAEALLAEGYEPALIYERSLLGLTAMEKLLGKKRFTEVLGELVEKPAGKPTLVPVSDKRPAVDLLSHFSDESQEDNT